VRARTGFKVGAVVDLVYKTIAEVVAIIAKNSDPSFVNSDTRTATTTTMETQIQANGVHGASHEVNTLFSELCKSYTATVVSGFVWFFFFGGGSVGGWFVAAIVIIARSSCSSLTEAVATACLILSVCRNEPCLSYLLECFWH